MKFPLDLTTNNVNNMLMGRSIQLKKEQLTGNKHYVVVHPTTHKKMSQALSKGKGVRILLTPDEFNASGEGFMDILRGIKKGAQWIKTHVIDSSTYQTAIKPIVRELVNVGTAAVAPPLGPLAPLAKQGIDKLGEVTNAYGLVSVSKVSKPKSKSKVSKPKAKKIVMMDQGGSFMIN